MLNICKVPSVAYIVICTGDEDMEIFEGDIIQLTTSANREAWCAAIHGVFKESDMTERLN